MSELIPKLKTYKPFSAIISYDYIPSINNAYIRVGKRVVLTEEAVVFKNTIKNCLWALSPSIDWMGDYPWVYDKSLWFDLKIHVLFNNTFNRRDTSNVIKLSEDAFSDFMEINDNANLFVSSQKFRINTPKEYIILTYHPSQCDPDAYQKMYDAGKIKL